MPERTVLFVDDEKSILQALKRLLRKEPYRTLTAESGEDGLKLLAQETVHLVVSDQRMPGLSGTEFLQKVKEESPSVVRVILSGYADAATILESINKGEIYRFLTKPWNEEELKTALRQCLEHYELLEDRRAMIGQLHELNELLEQDLGRESRFGRMYRELLRKVPIPGRPVPFDERRKRRVLVVEDNEAAAKVMAKALGGSGFEVEMAQDGFRAGTLMGTFGPAVVTLDLMMPGIHGLEVLRFLRGMEQFGSVKILVVSAMPKKQLDRAREEGADDVLEKPFESKDLVERVTRLTKL
jgi:CheY-like chemotaxis protein